MGSEITASAARANLSFGDLVVKSLMHLGVQHFVLSPGSRSTPLALAAAKLDGEMTSLFLDERSAAFHALGRIKATRCPVAVICTSGTAGAHYYPAMIEAREAGLPLIVLTADRPPELRHCHAGQTIDQTKLFGTYPLFHAELPLPEGDLLLMRQVREICRQAIESALGLPNGPVHLNCPYREPFFPADGRIPELDASLLDGLTPVKMELGQMDEIPDLPERTLVLAGPRPWQDKEEDLDALIEMAKRRGFPILADGSNPLRYCSAPGSGVIIHYDRVARNDGMWESLAPEALLLWGEPPTSKVLRQQLAKLDLPGYQVGPGKRGMNPFHGRVRWAGSSVDSFCQRVTGKSGNYSDAWKAEDEEQETSLVKAMARPHDFFEGDVHRVIGEALPSGSPVFFASSLAIRDADWFMPARSAPLSPFSQRGANGIDGTLSLVRGIAAGSRRPAFLVTGDLAFLHDSNGLLGSATDDPGTFVVLLNNAGGGIFEFLPVAKQEVNFERFFATPQPVDFRQLVEAHGGTYRNADSADWLKDAIEGWNGKGLFVAEVPIDRKSSRELHGRFLKL